MTQPDTAADFDTAGGGETIAPRPYVLGDAPGPLSRAELRLLDAWWRAANYLAVGQIYLMDNPLLREPLRAEHVKPRLLGHFGTVPGLNLLSLRTVMPSSSAALEASPWCAAPTGPWRASRPGRRGPARPRRAGIALPGTRSAFGISVSLSWPLFVPLVVDVELTGQHRLEICFRALTPHLENKGARARWRPRMIQPSGLRNVRTTALGRMPGFAPPAPPVGPWRDVELVSASCCSVRSSSSRVRSA